MTTSNPFLKVLHKFKMAWRVLIRKNYYLISFDINNNRDVTEISVETYNCNNQGVKDMSKHLYEEFEKMDSVSRQVNDILNNPN